MEITWRTKEGREIVWPDYPSPYVAAVSTNVLKYVSEVVFRLIRENKIPKKELHGNDND